jgi:hypothetical protein
VNVTSGAGLLGHQPARQQLFGDGQAGDDLDAGAGVGP